MSYCVNCGAELGKDLKRCPLCGTEVINPNEEKYEGPGFFPASRVNVPPVSKKELALLLSAMLASVALCCALLNLALRPDTVWSLYAAGACAVLWVWAVLPLLIRGMPAFVRLGTDLLAAALYVLLIAAASGGMDWYLRLALPLILCALILSVLICLALRGGHRSILTTVMLILSGIGIMSVLTELFLDLYLYSRWTPLWSLVVLAVCLGFCIPLLIARLVPSLREELRRRFHL